MIEHTLGHRRFRSLSLRKIAKGSVVVGFASLVLAGQMDFAKAAPAPAMPASSALRMGGIAGSILDIFNSRDPLRKVKPDQYYKTKYGVITGAEYERRVLEERVKAYEAAIRAGGTSRADWSTRKRAREVERKIRRDDEVTTAASGMMAAGDWEDRAAAETVLKAAEEEKSGLFRSTRSSRPAFRKGMGSYRTPTRADEVRDNQGTVYMSSATGPSSDSPLSSQAPPVVSSSSSSSDLPMRSLATMKPTTHTPAPVAPSPKVVTPPAPPAPPAPSASSTVEVPEVKMIAEPKVNTAPPEPRAVKAKTVKKVEPGSGHADMSSKEKLRMAVFGEPSEVEEEKKKGSKKAE